MRRALVVMVVLATAGCVHRASWACARREWRTVYVTAGRDTVGSYQVEDCRARRPS